LQAIESSNQETVTREAAGVERAAALLMGCEVVGNL